MKKILTVLLCLVVLGFLVIFLPEQSKKRVIGVIVPMEHTALNQIVEGFKKELEANEDVIVKVFNAQGDMNLQRALIQQLVQMDCDLFVPIGTTTSQMTLNLASNRKVVCLAADPDIISGDKSFEATALDDNVSVRDSIVFLHKAFPEIDKITLFYSSSEKVSKEIPVVLEEARLKGISVQKLMIQNMSDLYSASQAVENDSKAILILKDHLIVSGVSTLLKQAEKRRIPVMTSDEGSVISGGCFALGVRESEIGAIGGAIVKAILNGTSPKMIPSKSMTDSPMLFINRESCHKMGIDLPSLIREAQTLSISIEYVKEGEDVL